MPLSPRYRIFGMAGVFALACGTGPRPLPPAPAERGSAPASARADAQATQFLTGAVADQARVERIAFGLLSRSASLCPAAAVHGRIGLRALSAADYAPAWRTAAVQALGLSDSLTVVAVVPGSPGAEAGLRPGDRVLRVGTALVGTGPTASARFREGLGRALAAGGGVQLLIERGDTFFDPTLRARAACDIPTAVAEGDVATAWSDGASIYITRPLLRALSDQEVGVVLAHELGHVLRHHIVGPTVGTAGPADAPADPALPRIAGLHPGTHRMPAPPAAFSPDQERDADSTALGSLALAGIPPDAAFTFWRNTAGLLPAFTAAHPATPDRLQWLATATAALRRTAAVEPPAGLVAAPHPSPGERPFAAAPAPTPAVGGAAQQTPTVLGRPVSVKASPAAAPTVLGRPVAAQASPAAAPPAAALAPTRVVVVTGEPTWLYATPDIESSPIGRLDPGARLTVRGEKGDWLEVAGPAGRGYVLAQDTRPEGR